MADTKQVTIRLDDATRTAFAELCNTLGLSMQQVLETYIENAIANRNDHSVRHMDGNLCPLSALLQGITTGVLNNLAQSRIVANPPQPKQQGWTAQRNQQGAPPS